MRADQLAKLRRGSGPRLNRGTHAADVAADNGRHKAASDRNAAVKKVIESTKKKLAEYKDKLIPIAIQNLKPT